MKVIIRKCFTFQQKKCNSIDLFLRKVYSFIILFSIYFMSYFLKETIQGRWFELYIDTKVFPKDIILKTAYNFLDEMYFFFRYDEKRNFILEWNLKSDTQYWIEDIVASFSDELLNVYLRDKLERENRVIRESIVNKALLGPLDSWSYVSHDPENPKELNLDANNSQVAEIDFDKDIDEIIKEIENDPDLQIDEDEIQQMLKEIEEETANENLHSMNKPIISIDPDSVKDVKKQFKKDKKTKKK